MLHIGPSSVCFRKCLVIVFIFLFSLFPWSLCSPCPCIIVVPQVAIFSYGTDINGMTAQRKSSREGATVRHTLPSFLLLIKANTPVNEQRECVWKSGWGRRHRSPPGHFNDTSRRCCLPFLVPSVLIIFRSAVTVTGFCYLLQSQDNSVYITLDYKFAERIFLPFI